MANRTVGQVVTAPQYNEDTFDIGDVRVSAKRQLPAAGWLAADGSAQSRTTFAALFAAIVPSLGTFTVTLASPGVFTLVAHGLSVGDSLFLTTTGALPTGLAANTLYYVVSVPTADTFTVSATEGGTAINTSVSQSGTHTAWLCLHGLGDGSTTFNLPHGDVEGILPAAGTTPIAGLGFTYTHASTGLYVVTFSNPFAAAPVVTVTPDTTTFLNLGAFSEARSPSGTGFTAGFYNTSQAGVDVPFSFRAGVGIGGGHRATAYVKYA